MSAVRLGAIALLLGLSACEPSLLPAKSSTNAVLIASPYPENEVRAAIVRSLNEGKFKTESEDAGYIRARYERGDQMIQIGIEYSGSQYRVLYLDSEGFQSQKQGDELLIDERYHKQITKLKKRIDLELERPARDAAAAQQAQADAAQAQADAAQAQAAPPPDTRTEGQVIVDIITTVGYQCVPEASRWVCSSPGKDWPVTVEYVRDNGVTTIWFDSYSTRAFAKPCNQFQSALKDLADPERLFSATCDDNTQAFRFNTAVFYGPDLDVAGWIKLHEDRRVHAHGLLDSIGALRK